jgi:hypothetical protein
MTDQDKIEESHGLWEMAIVRLAAMAELNAPRNLIDIAVAEERAAFKVWQEASNRATSK